MWRNTSIDLFGKNFLKIICASYSAETSVNLLAGIASACKEVNTGLCLPFPIPGLADIR